MLITPRGELRESWAVNTRTGTAVHIWAHPDWGLFRRSSRTLCGREAINANFSNASVEAVTCVNCKKQYERLLAGQI